MAKPIEKQKLSKFTISKKKQCFGTLAHRQIKKGELMKTIIKIEKKTSLEISPCQGGGVVLEVKTDYGNSTSSEVFRLTGAQAGALISAIEFAENFGGQ